MPISYKQFSNLIAGKNEFYKELVKRNGKEDPLKKTLIIIDEAHKLFAEDTPVAERPNVNLLKKAIYKSYEISKEDSCRLLLMTATPYTNDPIQLFKLLNLLRTDDYFPEDFEEFKEEYLDDNYKFRKEKGENKKFLDKISGYISYLNREKDARQFAYPVIYLEEVMMSSAINKYTIDVYEMFMEEIKDYIEYDLEKAKEVISNLKERLKEDKKMEKKPNENISQEEGFDDCMKKKKTDNGDNKIKQMEGYVKEMTKIIKDKEKEIKNEMKVKAKEKKAKAKGMDFEIIDKTEKFVEMEIFYQIDAMIGREEYKTIGIRIPADEFENFENLGQLLIDNGLDEARVIKNTKKECVIENEEVEYTITHKKDKKFVIYIITPDIID